MFSCQSSRIMLLWYRLVELVKALIDEFMELFRRKLSRHTRDAYLQTCRNLSIFFKLTLGGPAIGGPPILREYLAQLKNRGLTRTTVARKIASLRSFYKYLARQEIVDKNPVLGVVTPKKERRLPQFLYPQEMLELLELPGQHSRGIRDRAIMETLYGAGIRCGELVGLDLEDLDLSRGYIRVLVKALKSGWYL